MRQANTETTETFHAIEDGPMPGDMLIPESEMDLALLVQLIQDAVSKYGQRTILGPSSGDPDLGTFEFHCSRDTQDGSPGVFSGELIIESDRFPARNAWETHRRTLPARFWVTYNAYTTQPYALKVWWQAPTALATLRGPLDFKDDSNYLPYGPVISEHIIEWINSR